MRNTLLLLLSVYFILPSYSQSKPPSAEVQIKTALMAAPENKRDSATVYGYSENNQLVILKNGTNELICVADDPSQPEFSVVCYHKDLQAFMQRGRDLRKLGRSHQEVF